MSGPVPVADTSTPVAAGSFPGRPAHPCDPEDDHVEITRAGLPDNPVVAAARRAAR